MVKLSLITSFLGQTKDRFHVYNEPLSLEEKFQYMNKIENFDGVELIHPYEVPKADELKALLKKYNLKMAAVNVNVKGEKEFVSGGITSAKPEVRAKALQFLKNSKDYAAEVGADKVTCCPLGDGFEFAFQYDYKKTWKYMVDIFGEAASYKPEIPLFIEYKPSETRAQCFLDNAAKTLVLINQAKTKSLGVTIDFGHSIYGGENPAEAVQLVADNGTPMYIHINDNNGKWDWDFFCGAKNFIEYVEFLYYLKRNNYNDYLTSDTSPTRWDIIKTFEANGRLTNRIWDFLENTGEAEINKILMMDDYLEAWKKIEKYLFGLKVN